MHDTLDLADDDKLLASGALSETASMAVAYRRQQRMILEDLVALLLESGGEISDGLDKKNVVARAWSDVSLTEAPELLSTLR